MEANSHEFPHRRWERSAPESQVLLTGPETLPGQVISIALLDLVARRVLRLVEVRDRILVFPKRRIVLVHDDRGQVFSSSVLRRVMDAYGVPRRFADGTIGLTVTELVTRLQRTHRANGGFVQAVVLPVLQGNGHFRQERYDRLGMFQRTRWVFTDSGRQVLAELRAIMDYGRGPLNSALASDPARAAAFVETAGPAVLLLDAIGITMQLLQRSLETMPGDAVTATHDSVSSFPTRTGLGDGRRGNAFTVAALAGQFGPGALDGLDAAYHTIQVQVGKALSSGSGGGGE